MPMAIWWVAGLVAVLLALLPRCGYSGTCEHRVTSAIGVILIIFLLLILLARV
jgi:hypothetical protein